MHPLYQERLGWNANQLPAATLLRNQIISLPIFSSMTVEEAEHVVETVKRLCFKHATGRMSMAA
jgi:dTDP-4-amino-4,6-dideoxygalactose transaminase